MAIRRQGWHGLLPAAARPPAAAGNSAWEGLHAIHKLGHCRSTMGHGECIDLNCPRKQPQRRHAGTSQYGSLLHKPRVRDCRPPFWRLSPRTPQTRVLAKRDWHGCSSVDTGFRGLAGRSPGLAVVNSGTPSSPPPDSILHLVFPIYRAGRGGPYDGPCAVPSPTFLAGRPAKSTGRLNPILEGHSEAPAVVLAGHYHRLLRRTPPVAHPPRRDVVRVQAQAGLAGQRPHPVLSLLRVPGLPSTPAAHRPAKPRAGRP
jgi:hypothetical protein